MTSVLQQGPLNPSSLHTSGRIAREHVDLAIDHVGASLDSRLDQPGGARLIFTSGGTESNNLALRGLCEGRTLLISQIEHPSVIAVGRWLEKRGIRVKWIRVESCGRVCLEHLKLLMDDLSNQPANA